MTTASPITAATAADLPDGPFEPVDYFEAEPAERNYRRATFASSVVRIFATATGIDDDEPATAISDLLCDLQHLADALGLDWADLTERGAGHHAAEIAGRE